MKTTNYYCFVLFIAVISLLAACSGSGDAKKEKLEKLKKQHAEISKEIKVLENEMAAANPEALQVRAKEVSITAVAPKDFEHYIQTQGLIESENNIQVSAKSPGVVTHVFVKEGQQVSAGQVLGQTDNSVIRRNIESMKSQLELATTVYERQKNLWDQKIGTEVQFLQAKTGKESLEKQIASLQEQEDMTRIKAPISGTVDAVNMKVGESVGPGAPAARIVNGSSLKLSANVSEAYANIVDKNNKAIITVPAIGKEFEAKVTFVGRNIDPLSRTFPIEVAMKSVPELRPNMTATVRIVFQTSKDALVVPVNIIQTVNGEKILYTAETNGKNTVARKKVVNVSGVYNNQAEVTGLKTGDKIITFGYQGLSDGEIIKI